MHHGSEDWKPEALGATQRFPEGKLKADDEGELRFAVGTHPQTKKVIIQWGKPVSWIGMTAAQALDLADSLQKQARSLGGS